MEHVYTLSYDEIRNAVRHKLGKSRNIKIELVILAVGAMLFAVELASEILLEEKIDYYNTLIFCVVIILMVLVKRLPEAEINRYAMAYFKSAVAYTVVVTPETLSLGVSREHGSEVVLTQYRLDELEGIVEYEGLFLVMLPHDRVFIIKSSELDEGEREVLRGKNAKTEGEKVNE